MFFTFTLMKETVTDISAMFEKLTSQVQSMQETINALHTEIAGLNRNVNRLTNENRILRKRLSKYETPDKNSNNSSTPPPKESMKDEVMRRTKSLRTPSGLKPGGQPGHKAHDKEMAERPDAIEERMSEYCRNCGRNLSCVEGELDYVSQVVDLSAVAPIITEYRHYRKTCRCCNKGYAPSPPQQSNNFWQEHQGDCNLFKFRI